MINYEYNIPVKIGDFVSHREYAVPGAIFIVDKITDLVYVREVKIEKGTRHLHLYLSYTKIYNHSIDEILKVMDWNTLPMWISEISGHIEFEDVTVGVM